MSRRDEVYVTSTLSLFCLLYTFYTHYKRHAHSIFFPNKNIDIGFSDKWPKTKIMELDIKNQLHGDAFAFQQIEKQKETEINEK